MVCSGLGNVYEGRIIYCHGSYTNWNEVSAGSSCIKSIAEPMGRGIELCI